MDSACSALTPGALLPLVVWVAGVFGVEEVTFFNVTPNCSAWGPPDSDNIFSNCDLK
jgi:hypothetical protein